MGIYIIYPIRNLPKLALKPHFVGETSNTFQVEEPPRRERRPAAVIVAEDDR